MHSGINSNFFVIIHKQSFRLKFCLLREGWAPWTKQNKWGKDLEGFHIHAWEEVCICWMHVCSIPYIYCCGWPVPMHLVLGAAISALSGGCGFLLNYFCLCQHPLFCLDAKCSGGRNGGGCAHVWPFLKGMCCITYCSSGETTLRP